MIALGMLSGCAAVKVGSSDRPVWPEPPEQARFEYVSTLRTDLGFSGRQPTMLERLGGAKEARSNPLFSKPYDVAARAGVVVISDTVWRVVHMLLLPSRTIFRLGAGNVEEGGLVKPAGVAIGADGKIYVADVTQRLVKMYDSSGHYIRTIGGPEYFDRPTDVAASLDGSRIYVVDIGGVESRKHQIQVFDAEGGHIETIGRRGNGDGEFNLPVQLAVNQKDELHVLDAGNFRVQVFSPDGQYLRSWGQVGRNGGDFARPRGLAIDADDLVYVTDTAFGNFQVFRSDGQLLLAVGSGGADKPGSYSLPAGVAVDEFGWVYVLDQRYRKLDILRKIEVDGG